MLLVQVMVAKVDDQTRFIGFLRNTPVMQEVVGWNCVACVQNGW